LITLADESSKFIDHLLAPGGLVSSALADYEPRPCQLKMSHAVSRAFYDNENLAVEAGTGTGKSLAYLAAAVEKVKNKDCRVLMSTYTITLQQQLINKDLPLLASITPTGFKASLAKGRQNYICLRRLDFAKKNPKNLFYDDAEEIEKLNKWAQTTQDGSLSELPFIVHPNVWDKVKSEHGNCPARKCTHFPKCFYRNARRQLESSDIIVANHALTISDLILKKTCPGLLPPYEYIIIDEAHNLENASQEQFGLEVSNFGIDYLLRSLYHPGKRRGFVTCLDNKTELTKIIRTCKKAAKVFFTQIQAWLDHTYEKTGGTCHPEFVEDNITPEIKKLRTALTCQSKKFSDEDNEKYELTRYIDRCRTLEIDIDRFLTQPDLENHVYWVERSGKPPRRRILLKSAPLAVAPYLKEHLFDPFDSVVLTSATISCTAANHTQKKPEPNDDFDNTDEDNSNDITKEDFSDTYDEQSNEKKQHDPGFEFFAQTIGLENYRSLALDSPFDYAKQVRIYIEAKLPEPNDPSFVPRACRALQQYIDKSDGRAFVLFTSYSMMSKFAEHLDEWFARNSYSLFVQGTDLERSVMLERFRSTNRAVLFGTDSFWQGVDVPGEALSNVIIVRLPFAVPGHPLIKGRIKRLRSLGKNPFSTFQLPQAILKFKQGFGRLIRTKNDKGIIAVLDSRIVTRRYGQSFLNAVPAAEIEIVSSNPEEQYGFDPF
jgi:ATP-dependent DNA helicase DinG